jgi:hypothetical protein
VGNEKRFQATKMRSEKFSFRKLATKSEIVIGPSRKTADEHASGDFHVRNSTCEFFFLCSYLPIVHGLQRVRDDYGILGVQAVVRWVHEQ